MKQKKVTTKLKTKALNKALVSSSAIALDDVGKALEEIRKFKDLRKFQLEKTDEFCKKYNIKSGQLNFLISVVGAERAKASGAMG